MLADFRAFCDNDENRLFKFWNEPNKIANEQMVEKQENQGEYSDNTIIKNI